MFATDMQTLLVFPTWDIKDFNVQPEPRVCKTLNIYTYTKLKYNIQIYIFIAKKVDQIASLKENLSLSAKKTWCCLVWSFDALVMLQAVTLSHYIQILPIIKIINICNFFVIVYVLKFISF